MRIVFRNDSAGTVERALVRPTKYSCQQFKSRRDVACNVSTIQLFIKTPITLLATTYSTQSIKTN